MDFQLSFFRYNNGHLFIPGCALYPMSDIDCPDLTWIFELSRRQDFYSHQIFVRFEAGSRWFNVGIQLSYVKTDFLKAEITFNCHRGHGSIHCQTTEHQDFIGETMNVKIQDTGKWILPLDCLEATLEAVSGGKGASLAQMFGMKLESQETMIPKGLVVTIHGFQNHLEFNHELKDHLKHLQHFVNALCSETNEDKRCSLQKQLQDQCSKVVQAFEQSQINPELIKQLYEIGGIEDHIRFAIRSSALGEDSQDLSSAGQNETILGCKGLESILRAIKKCWGSLFAYQSVEYRRQNGELVVTSMAVVIQEMVDAEMAGVLFSRHPVTGNPMEIVITANYGLGEVVNPGFQSIPICF